MCVLSLQIDCTKKSPRFNQPNKVNYSENIFCFKKLYMYTCHNTHAYILFTYIFLHIYVCGLL